MVTTGLFAVSGFQLSHLLQTYGASPSQTVEEICFDMVLTTPRSAQDMVEGSIQFE